jgi:hypothetical protein
MPQNKSAQRLANHNATGERGKITPRSSLTNIAQMPAPCRSFWSLQLLKMQGQWPQKAQKDTKSEFVNC